jgi:hypothetical protein
MATIFITSNSPKGTNHGRFPLQRDDKGPFAILPGGKFGVKVYLKPEHIKPAPKNMGADFFCELPVQYQVPENN